MFESKAQARGTSAREVEAIALQSVSMGTMVTPIQIADQVAFLCSEGGRTISGQAISICGDLQTLVRAAIARPQTQLFTHLAKRKRP